MSMRPLRFAALALTVFVGLSALYLWAYLCGVRQPLWPYDWLRNVYIAKEQIATESKTPRWLIIGGSSAWFGFQSQLIENATGANVVNLGMHAELPLYFQLWEVERHAQRGDTILMAEELRNFWAERPYTTYSAIEIGMMAPKYFWETSCRQKLFMLGAVPPERIAAGVLATLGRGSKAFDSNLTLPSSAVIAANLKARWDGTFTGAVPNYYNYLEIDRHGDMTRPREHGVHAPLDYGLHENHPKVEVVWSTLAAFAQRMRARGVRCVFTWQPFEAHAGFDLGDAQASTQLEQVRQWLVAAGWEQASKPEDSLLPSDVFYDTPFHLTTEGARRRTERLIEQLRREDLIHSS